MVNYMLRVNLSIAVVEMVMNATTSNNDTTNKSVPTISELNRTARSLHSLSEDDQFSSLLSEDDFLDLSSGKERCYILTV